MMNFLNTNVTTSVRIGVKKLACISALLLFAQSAGAAECHYDIVDNWNSGFKVEVSIINDGPAIEDWQIDWQWTDGATLNNSWNANFDCQSGSCSVTPPTYATTIANGQTYTFGFVANKGVDEPSVVSISSDICNDSQIPNTARVAWQLDAENSSIHYVSVKKDHIAEVNTFLAADGEASALNGSIESNGNALFSVDLNDVSSGIEIRDGRLVSLLFETGLLPTAYFNSSIDLNSLTTLNVGETIQQSLTGTLILHGVQQDIISEVLIAKLSPTQISVSTLAPVIIDSKNFDLDAGIEALRLVANLSSIGESVPVYFSLTFTANTEETTQPLAMPTPPFAPSELQATFDPVNLQANLAWLDNSELETDVLVRRKAIDGRWQTIAELAANATGLIEGLPDAGEFNYKVISLNNGVPSLPSNIANVLVTEGNQLARGQQIYQNDCAACHGQNGEGIGSFPAINTERNVADMIDYIRDFMPQGNAATCDQQCAEDVAVFIETLWVTQATCDVDLTPISYGPRQLKILTRFEYQNSVEDLLGVDFAASDGLSEDTKVGFFLNNTYAAIVPTSYSNYLLVAEEIAQWSAQRDFAPALECTSYNQDCADKFVAEFGPKIFRRPLHEEEVTTYLTMANGSHTSGDVKLGIQLALEGMLSSPQFLYRHELGETAIDNPDIDSDAYELTPHEMATFLAYTFTGSTPDQTLLDAANNDLLETDEQIMTQIARIADNAKGVMSKFVGSWLGTEDLDLAAKDQTAWPEFADLVPHMINEMNEMFSYVMLEPNENFRSLYTADYTFINEALAQHYDIAGVEGDEIRKVDTNDRGGILANGAFMARWGEQVETSPILRSVRVRRRMLCQDQPDPPAGTFAAREEKLAELSELLQDPTTTNRLKYHRLTEDTPCTNCHLQYINPLGFGMEDFDTVGRVRSTDLNGNQIDAMGELFAPISYSDIDTFIPFVGTQELGGIIADLESAQSCLPKQMFRYVLGVGHQEIDPANPESTPLSDAEKSGYACEIDRLTNTLMDESPRAMLEKFGALQAVRYRKAWQRN